MEDKRPSKVLNFLYIGSRHHAKDKKLLAELNIKYILNCTPKRSDDPESGCPNFYEKDKMFVYKRIPLFDNKGEDILPYMEGAIRFIGEGQHYGSVLVHCHRGISRSASFVIGYLIRQNELTLEEALSHVQSCRPVVQPNSSFLAQLQAFAAKSEQGRGRPQPADLQPTAAVAPAEEQQGVAGPVEATEAETESCQSGAALGSSRKRPIHQISTPAPAPAPSEDYGPALGPTRPSLLQGSNSPTLIAHDHDTESEETHRSNGQPDLTDCDLRP